MLTQWLSLLVQELGNTSPPWFYITSFVVWEHQVEDTAHLVVSQVMG